MSPASTGVKSGLVFKKGSKLTPDLTRLPNSVIPKRYELKLDVEPELKKYSGQVNIRIFVLEDSADHTIWLHSKNLEIVSASIQFSQFAIPTEVTEVIEVPEKSCIGLSFPPSIDLSKGCRAWLHIEFNGKLSQSLEGFFSNPYVDIEGNKR